MLTYAPLSPAFRFSFEWYTECVPPQRTARRSNRPIRFPNRIHFYRIKAALTQAMVGKAVGRLRWAVSAWERGVTLPRVRDLFRLAWVLHTLIESLYPSLYEEARKPDLSAAGA
jgi:DNA-binding XRE family transcriptional regulator